MADRARNSRDRRRRRPRGSGTRSRGDDRSPSAKRRRQNHDDERNHHRPSPATRQRGTARPLPRGRRSPYDRRRARRLGDERRRRQDIAERADPRRAPDRRRAWNGPTKFQKLNELPSSDSNQVVLALLSDRNGPFSYFTHRTIRDDTLIVLLVRILAVACEPVSMYSAPSLLGQLLDKVGQSAFLADDGPLVSYVERNRETMTTSVVTDVAHVVGTLIRCRADPDACGEVVAKILAYLECYTPPDDSAAMEAVKYARELLDGVKRAGNSSGSDILDQEISIVEPEVYQLPDDFRSIPIIPTVAEIMSDLPPVLHKNVVRGSYRNLDQYLDVQYRLLREDFVYHLRTGLKIFRQSRSATQPRGQRQSDVRIYNGVRIVSPYCTPNALLYRIRFDVRQFRRPIRWDKCSRLMTGSLVGLLKVDSDDLVFGTIARRDVLDLKKGFVDLSFEEQASELLDPNPYIVYDMIESSSAYFESYKHVLQRLKDIQPGQFPFQEYILNTPGALGDVGAPLYIRDRSSTVRYRFDCLMRDDGYGYGGDGDDDDDDDDDDDYKRPLLNLGEWPSKDELGLDESQYAALQTAMTKEYVTIQGPPGTGKTFVGLKIVQLLLRNRKHFDRSPILVVCFTNHALDQFLEMILRKCSLVPGQLIRIGGRSSSDNEKLLACSLFEVKKRDSRRHRKNAVRRARKLIREQREEMCELQEQMTMQLAHVYCARKWMINEQHLQHYMTPEQTYWLQSRPIRCDSILMAWLTEGNPGQNIPTESGTEDGDEATEDDEEIVMQSVVERDVDDLATNIHMLDHLKDIKNVSLNLQRDICIHEGMISREQEHGELSDEIFPETEILRPVTRSPHFIDAMPLAESQSVADVWELSPADRWRLYNYWVSCYCDEAASQFQQLATRYDRHARRLAELRNEEDYHVLTQARVIGMTTTGAAKYRQLLQRVDPKIVIVEEAAEVLEAQVVTTLSSHCQHLIMIGDHQQLRPKPTVYKLEKQYKLDVSLFERMVTNNLHCDRLTIQHRMRPEIVRLIVPHIYQSLDNHPSVLEYEQIRGVKGSVFFVRHSELENDVEDSMSHSNMHEATFLAALCRYLLRQGYERTQITVLTPYKGQVLLLRRLMPKSGFEGVRITAVDNYQGEENDIVLMSLVRSNASGQIGFLSDCNRVCVALSRAKKGLFIIGNADLVSTRSRLWRSIIQDMSTAGLVVDALPLGCQNHPDSKVDVRCEKDFVKVPEGGCDLDCDWRLDCGHCCAMKCHPTNRDHRNYTCRKRCAREVCINKHRCPKLCFEPCSECRRLVEKTVPGCGHKQKMPCHLAPESFRCNGPCEKLLHCQHPCMRRCGDLECTSECRAIVRDREWPCGHKLTVQCHRNPQNFPCNVQLDRELRCGHTVKMACGANVDDYLCRVVEVRLLARCGHTTKMECHKNVDEYICKVLETRTLARCGHTAKMECHKNVDDYICRETVPVKLCEVETHKNKSQCCNREAAASRPCNKQVIAICRQNSKHIYRVKCHERNSNAMPSCPSQCSAQLPCGHRCVGKCAECSNRGGHTVCRTPCQRFHPCGHKCTATCGETCPPCMWVNMLYCAHQQFTRQCGDPYSRCSKPCHWRCPHRICELPCWQPCARPPCDRRCPSQLACWHYCMGLCGEPCPPCPQCNRLDVKGRVIQLQPCGCVVSVREMDEWVEGSTPQTPCRQPQGVTCVKCHRNVLFCPRYGRRIKEFMLIADIIKTNATVSARALAVRALDNCWPADGQSDELAQRLDKVAGGRPPVKIGMQEITFRGLAFGAVCVWQECWDVLQACNRMEIGRKMMLAEAKRLDDARCGVMKAVADGDHEGLVRRIASMQMAYLNLHARRMAKFVRNPRLQSVLCKVILSTDCSSREDADWALCGRCSENNLTLVENFSLKQRGNIKDFIQRLHSYFQSRRMEKILLSRIWAVCRRGHPYGVDKPADDTRCPTCDGSRVSRRDLADHLRRRIDVNDFIRHVLNPLRQLDASESDNSNEPWFINY